MSEHTKGPWFLAVTKRAIADLEAGEIFVYTMDGAQIGAFHVSGGRIPFEEQLANALLFAAAPDLLAALRGLVEWADTESTNPEGTLQRRLAAARAAIVKVEGPAQGQEGEP